MSEYDDLKQQYDEVQNRLITERRNPTQYELNILQQFWKWQQRFNQMNPVLGPEMSITPPLKPNSRLPGGIGHPKLTPLPISPLPPLHPKPVPNPISSTPGRMPELADNVQIEYNKVREIKQLSQQTQKLQQEKLVASQLPLKK